MPRARHALALGLGLALFATADRANAQGGTTTTWIAATGFASGSDVPQDGVFDELIDGYAAITNNGYTDLRGRFVFPLAGVPASGLATASMHVYLGNFEGTRSLVVHAFGGDCGGDLADFTRGALVGTSIVGPTGYATFVHDATALVVDARANGWPCLEVVLRESPANDVNYTVMYADSATLAVEAAGAVTRTVDIDIRPASMPNKVGLTKGQVPVALLSSGELGAAAVDPASLTFGRSGDEISLARCEEALRDVNGDGLADLVCQFRTSLCAFLTTDTEAVLKGTTWDGQPVRGTDSVRIVH